MVSVKKGDSGFQQARRAVSVFGFLLVVWGFYRVLFRFPETLEELVFKPVIWFGVVLWMLAKERKGLSSVGWTGKGWRRSVGLGLGLGAAFLIEGIVANYVNYAGIKLVGLELGTSGLLIAMLVSLATAVSEETAFRGYIQTRLAGAGKNKWVAVVLTALMFTLIHLPIWFFGYRYTASEMFFQFVVSMAFGLGNGILMAVTGSILGPVVAHVLWGWGVVLLR